MSKKKENQDHFTCNDLISWPKALTSYFGHLEGRKVSFNTIRNYESDLKIFGDFLINSLKISNLNNLLIKEISTELVYQYRCFLESDSLHGNTLRRRVYTVQLFLEYLKKRKKIKTNKRMSVPRRILKSPYVVPLDQLKIKVLESFKGDGVKNLRNCCILLFLIETGAMISEVSDLLQIDFKPINNKEIKDKIDSRFCVRLGGKIGKGRSIPVSDFLIKKIDEYKTTLKQLSPNHKTDAVFCGFTGTGPLTTAISPRGIELIVKEFAQKIEDPLLTPRTIRHSKVFEMLKSQKSDLEILTYFGFKTYFPLTAFEPLLPKHTFFQSKKLKATNLDYS